MTHFDTSFGPCCGHVGISGGGCRHIGTGGGGLGRVVVTVVVV